MPRKVHARVVVIERKLQQSVGRIEHGFPKNLFIHFEIFAGNGKIYFFYSSIEMVFSFKNTEKNIEIENIYT